MNQGFTEKQCCCFLGTGPERQRNGSNSVFLIGCLKRQGKINEKMFKMRIFQSG